MKTLNNPLFKKFELNKINDLSKIVGGKQQSTTWAGGCGGSSGCDTIDVETNGGPDVILDGKPTKCDFVDQPCK